MKKILSLLFVMITLTISGQNIRTAINKASDKNPAKELRTLARAQGATEADIPEFEKRIKGLKGFSEQEEDSG
jgi:hypothetical protein